MLVLAKRATAQQSAASALTDFMFVPVFDLTMFVGPVVSSCIPTLERLSPWSVDAITAGLYACASK